MEEIIQKILAKEGRLKRYRDIVKQYKLNRTFLNNERKFFHRLDTKGLWYDHANLNNRMAENI